MKTGWTGDAMRDRKLQIANCKLQIVLLAALWAAAGIARAGDEDEEGPRLPVVGRPEFFDEEDGPIGTFQTPTVHVEPSDVQVEDPVTVTIRVVAAGVVRRPPKQIRLEKFPGFADQFYVEYPNDPSSRRLDDRTWEFTCTLKPRSTKVKDVPSFPFVFFTPGFVPAERGYQVRRTASVPLTVRPRTVVSPGTVQGGSETPEFPDSIYHVADGPTVLARPSAWSRDILITVGATGLLVPPVMCLAWCIVWRRRNPDTARRARQRRSYAAQLALTAMRQLGEGDDPEPAAVIVTEYLRQRYDFSAQEPTPAEVSTHLDAMGCSEDSIRQALEFFHACDAVRFAHTAPLEQLTLAGRQLILRLEADSCSPSAS
jgi:hypothetical protein